MKVTYGIFTPRTTKEFLDPIDWDLLCDIYLEYIKKIAPNVQIDFPEGINIGGVSNIIARLMSKLSETMTGGIYTFSTRSIQINTASKIKEYLLLIAIVHELTHALGFNNHKNKSGYLVGGKYNHFNEGVTQKIAEEVTDKFLARTDLGSKQSLYLRQVAHNLAITILGSDNLLEQTKQYIPAIGEMLSQDRQAQKVSRVVARELLNNPMMRAAIEQKVKENLDESDVYKTEIQFVDRLISNLSKHSGLTEGEVWEIIKRGYFEGIDIIELCTSFQYGIEYSKDELEQFLSMGPLKSPHD